MIRLNLIALLTLLQYSDFHHDFYHGGAYLCYTL